MDRYFEKMITISQASTRDDILSEPDIGKWELANDDRKL